MIDLVAIGHLTLDHIKIGEKFTSSLGGSAAYVSLTASKLGARAGIVSKVGKDFRFIETLRSVGVDLTGLRVVEKGTTTFENIYDGRLGRIQRVTQRCEEIHPKDIPEAYLEARCFHFGPLTGEVDYDVISEASMRGILTSLDIQGCCRSLGEDGSVQLYGWRKAREVLRHVNVLKSDLEEALLASGTPNIDEAIGFFWSCGVEVALVTLGAEGSFLGFNGEIRRVPAIKPVRVVDPTGAGDAYVAGFLFEYLRTSDPIRAAEFASTTASFVVEGEGLSGIPTEEAVRKRLMKLRG